ncbi:sensor histidine kinase [Sphingobacterium faecium]|uniref:sensor histidine kinase n=1 Tax=Sphingobacterium faecium TaxID=34087 RepID=UPI00320B6ED0
MERNFNWLKWYTPRVRIVCHILFWLLVTTLYYLNYNRLGGGGYIWMFIGKELFVTGSLFYSASWVIFKWVSKGKLYPLFIFVILAYIWWILCSYFTCYIARAHVPESDERLYRYLGFFLNGGFLDLFTFKKFAVLVIDFTCMVSIPLAPKLMKAILESSMKMVKLERDNLKMELDFLKSQVSPHFLFNTLNSIYRMSEMNDPETPDTVLRLSNLARYILYQGKNDDIFLSKEVDFIKDYINLATLRYGGKIPIESNIANIEEPYKIVPLILIPFVENAFKHGPDRSRSDAWIDISLRITDDRLIFSVKNGVNNAAEKPNFGGFGLQNVRRRLELHYPHRHKLTIVESENSYSVELTVDLK